MDKNEVLRLARLARVKLSDEEVERFPRELESILSYVGQVNEMVSVVDIKKEPGAVYNVFRDDVVTNESGIYTEKIMQEMPETKGKYLKVKKILSND